MKKTIWLGICILLGVGIIGSVVFGGMYFKALKNLKEVQAEKMITYTILDQKHEKEIQIDVEKGEDYAGIVRSGFVNYVTVPLIAIWAEDEEGNFLDTLYVSSKLLELDRKATLPVYMNKSGVVEGDKALPDAVTAASTKGIVLSLEGFDLDQPVRIYFECNRSYDYNETYHERLTQGERGYNVDFSGQPSLIYSATIESFDGERSIDFELIGHGSEEGSDGLINPDLSKVTTAKNLFSSLRIKTTIKTTIKTN